MITSMLALHTTALQQPQHSNTTHQRNWSPKRMAYRVTASLVLVLWRQIAVERVNVSQLLLGERNAELSVHAHVLRVARLGNDALRAAGASARGM